MSRTWIVVWLAAALGVTQPGSTAVQSVAIGNVLRLPGRYAVESSRCSIRLESDPLGGFVRLRIEAQSGHADVRDATGVAWVDKETVVYTASPIYGVPGLYSFSCSKGTERRLVGPRTIVKAYPDGADYFELSAVLPGRSPTVRLYYAPDVDTADFAHLRTEAFLYEVRLTRSGVTKLRRAGS